MVFLINYAVVNSCTRDCLFGRLQETEHTLLKWLTFLLKNNNLLEQGHDASKVFFCKVLKL